MVKIVEDDSECRELLGRLPSTYYDVGTRSRVRRRSSESSDRAGLKDLLGAHIQVGRRITYHDKRRR